MLGERLSDRYELLRELGRGGMGVVYLARDHALEREVAIKLLPPHALSPAAVERFRREARVVARMEHPGVVGIHDIAEHDGAVYLVMPFVGGVTLRALVDERPLAIEETLEVCAQVADALAYSHARGVVHRDVKPENVMVERTDLGRARARVLDFGIATVAHDDERLTGEGQLVGTAAYLSPEQIVGDEADERADVYALGAVIHECLTGKILFAGRPPVVLRRIASEPPPSLRELRGDVDPALDLFVLQCLEKDPSLRPQTAKEVGATLRRFLGDLGLDSTGVRVVTTLSVPRRRPARAALVGREAELRELGRRLAAAASGECQLVLVAGDAGAGKTRLLEEVEEFARGRSVRVLHGRFLERDQSFPYQGFCDAFHEHLRLSPTEDALAPSEHATLAADLADLFPSLAEGEAAITTLTRPVDEPAAAAPDRPAVFELLARSLVRVAAGRPLAVLFEELHAADVSVEALRYAFRRLAAQPILFVGTFRPSEIGRDHPLARLAADLRRDRRYAHLRLAPFARDESDQFVASLVGGPPTPRLATALFEAAEGNPYFTRELVRSLVDGGRVASDAEGAWDLARDVELGAGELPETIQAAVAERVERLPSALAELLSTASVLGRSFAAGALEGLPGVAPDLDDAIDRLVAEGFLVEERDGPADRLSFASGVLREVLYGQLSRRRRRALHRDYAEHLERRNAGRLDRVAGQLLFHFAAASDRERAVRYGLAAARAALDSCAPDEALRAARAALDAAREDETLSSHEGEARSLAAAALRASGDASGALREAAAAVSAFDRHGERRASCEGMAFAAETAWEARDVERARSWVERGLDAASATSAVRVRLLTLGATVANLRGDYERARAMLEEADAIEEADGAPSGAMRAGRARSGHLRVPFLPELATLDPALPTTNVALEALATVFETLTRTGDGASVEGWLAEEFRAEDGGRRYVFRLRQGVRFHDGRPLRARDVHESFVRLLSRRESENGWALAPILGARRVADGATRELDGFHELSELEFAIELDRPVAFFPALLAFIPTAILPEGTDAVGATWRDGCAGTGPFRVARFEPGRALELEANPDYWQAGRPRCEGLHFSFGVPHAEVREGFVEGRYSIARGVPAAEVEALRREPQLAAGYHETPQLTTAFLAFNTKTGPFANSALRQRLASVLDTTEVVRRALGRTAIPASCLVPPGLLGYEPPRRVTAPVLAHVTGTVDEAITVSCVALRGFLEGHYASLREELELAAARHGIRLVFADHSQSEADAARAAGAADACLWSWVADYPDADTFYHGVLHSETGIVGRFCGSDEIDRLAERGRGETDPATRHRVYREIETAIAERALLVPLSHPLVSCFARPEIAGLELGVATPMVAYERLWIRR